MANQPDQKEIQQPLLLLVIWIQHQGSLFGFNMHAKKLGHKKEATCCNPMGKSQVKKLRVLNKG